MTSHVKIPRYATIEKILGETPLEAAERLRKQLNLDTDVSLAYAGRLDPMATGTLLILIGKECKKQTGYHSLDKTYEVEILLGTSSDSGDVLGLLNMNGQKNITEEAVLEVLNNLPQEIKLQYPHFSSKTVLGKPLHTWTLEDRLGEIEIPTKTSNIHKIKFDELRAISKNDVLLAARAKIESLAMVTDPRKKLGADFRRKDVRKSWNHFENEGHDIYQILSFTCTASSGTYMRSLAEHIAKKLGTTGLAYSIHRTKIGRYLALTKSLGFWVKKY